MPQIDLSTAKGVASALANAGFGVPTKDAVAAISRVCREDFLSDLHLCASGGDADGAAHYRIERLLGCVSANTVEAARCLSLDLSLDDLVCVGRKFPVRFLSAIAAAINARSQKHEEAKAYLAEIAQSKPWIVPVPSEVAAPPVAMTAASAPLPEHESPTPRDEAPEKPASQVRSPATSQSSSAPDRHYRSAHVYGAGFALCFNAVPGQDGVPGVMVDAAVSSGPKTYDWAGAIHIMLDVREVACVLAVFRNWRKSVEFNAHGRNNDKSFSLEKQGPHYFCKVASKRQGANGGLRAVRILPADAHKVAMLFLEQLLLAYPTLPPSEVIELARTINTEEPAHQAA